MIKQDCYYLQAKKLYTQDGVLEHGAMIVEDGLIQALGTNIKPPAACRQFVFPDSSIIPGLIDVHIHGAGGFDTMDATPAAMEGIAQYLAQNGVTSFVAATMTAPLDDITAALHNVKQCMDHPSAGAKLLGAYVEGPYFTESYRGAHPAEQLRAIDLDEIKTLVRENEGAVKILAMAPEKEHGPELIRYLRQKGIFVTIGHSDASYEQMIQAADEGASLVTHLYNGMRPLHHRESGVIGAALCDDRLYTELIFDGIHISNAAMQIALRCKGPERAVLISDCMRAGGMPDGKYRLGTEEVVVKDQIARTANGSLAGSTLRLLNAVIRVRDTFGIPFETALESASLTPARLLGIDHITGSIAPGKTADIAVMDEDGTVSFTMADGRIVHNTRPI